MKILKKTWPYFVVLILSFWTIKPLLNNGFFPMHDDIQPARVFEMFQALKDGQFPVRWVKDLGYGFGYPLFNFYSPLPYYFGAGFMFAGVDEITAAKFMIGIGLLLSGIGMYLLGRHLWGKAGGLVSAVLYLYAPYHALQVYVRGAVGELYAYAFLPFIFFFLINRKDNFHLRIVGGGIFWALFILSHNISAMLAIIFFGLWFIYLLFGKIADNQKLNEVKLTVLIILLGLGLSAFFWLPALVESEYTLVNLLTSGSNDFRQHFVYTQQLWDSPWGYAGSAPGLADGMSFKIGKIHLLIALISVGYQVFKKSATNRKFLYFLIPAGLLAVWLMLDWSLFFWELIRPLAYVQYPWRLLVFLLFFLALAGGGIMQLIKGQKIRFSVAAIILGLLILINLKYFAPQTLYQPDSSAYSGRAKLNWELSKISDEYMTPLFQRPGTRSELLALTKPKNAIIIEQEIRSNRQKFIINNDRETLWQLSIADFPGWKVVVDQDKVQPQVIDGILYINVPPGKHLITAYLSSTPVRALGNLISLISAGLILVILINLNKKHFYNEKK